MTGTDKILDILDQKINSYLTSSKITARSIGEVVQVLGHNRLKVRLLGYDTIYEFPQRPYVDAQKGDNVFVESKIGNIDNGIVIDKVSGDYGYIYNANGGQEGETLSSDVMLKSEYDVQGNGRVDNADKVNNHTVKADVPEDAIFTDTKTVESFVFKDGTSFIQSYEQVRKNSQSKESNYEDLKAKVQLLEEQLELIKNPGYYKTK